MFVLLLAGALIAFVVAVIICTYEIYTSNRQASRDLDELLSRQEPPERG